MFTILLKLTGVLSLALSGVFALPSGYEGGNDLATRGLPPPDNIVYVTDVNTCKYRYMFYHTFLIDPHS